MKLSAIYKRFLSRLVIAVAATLLGLAVIFLTPFSRDTEKVVKEEGRRNNLTIPVGGKVEVSVTLPVDRINGVVLYSDPTPEKDNLQVILKNSQSEKLADSRRVKRIYAEERSELIYYFPTRRIETNQNYTLSVLNLGSEEIRLWSNNEKPVFSVTRNIRIEKEDWRYYLVPAVFIIIISLAGLINSERKRLFSYVILFVGFAPLVLSGLWKMDKWGISDFDFYFSTHEAFRRTILEYGVFPFWAPFNSGGTAGLADPEFSVISVTFLLELIFGVPLGIRLAILCSVVIGGLGMMMLAKKMKFSPESILLTGIVYSFGGVNLLEMAEGHVNIYASMWIPWVFWAWFCMARNKMKPIVCAIFLALMFYAGGIYLLLYVALAFLFLPLFTSKPVLNYLKTFKAALWSLGFSAFKLIPSFLFVSEFPDEGYASSANTLPWLKQILLERIPRGAEVIFQQGSGWHEYGAYIGWFVLLLAVVGLLKYNNKMTRVLFIATGTALLISAAGPALKPFFDAFPYVPRSNISRFVLFAVIPIILLAGYGIDTIRKKIKKGESFALLLVGLVALDLMSFANIISQQAFVLDPVSENRTAAFPIQYTADGYRQEKNGESFTRSYAAVLAGYGVSAFPAVIGPFNLTRTITDEDNDYAILKKGVGNIRVVNWNPNKVSLAVSAEADDELVINANYAPGWTANGRPALSVDGRVGTIVLAGQSKVDFNYLPPGVKLGAGISVATIVLAILLAGKNKFPYGTRPVQSSYPLA